MINYIEKGAGLHNEIVKQGHSLVHTDGVWVSSNEVAVQAIIDNYDPLPIAQAEAIKEIAQYASDLIDSKIDPLKAKRIQSDAISATTKKAKGNTLNAADNAKLDNLEAAMTYPDKIFAQYDIEEAAIIAATDWTLIDVDTIKSRLDAVI